MRWLAQSESPEVICRPEKLFVCKLRAAIVEGRDVCFVAIGLPKYALGEMASIHRLCTGRHLLNEICA